MNKALACLAVLPLAACATSQSPYAPVRNISYQAMGAEPFWNLAIGDDRIVLRSSLQEGESVWPRVLPRVSDGVRRWDSRSAAGSIAIEARPGPCETEGEEIFEDEVSVRIEELVLTGCGGRLIRRAPR